jgi:hypothetical protein
MLCGVDAPQLVGIGSPGGHDAAAAGYPSAGSGIENVRSFDAFGVAGRIQMASEEWRTDDKHVRFAILCTKGK